MRQIQMNPQAVREEQVAYLRGTLREFEVIGVTNYKAGVNTADLAKLPEDDATSVKLLVKETAKGIDFDSYCPFEQPKTRPSAFRNQPTIGDFWAAKMGTRKPGEWLGKKFNAKVIKVAGRNIHFDTRS